MRWLLVLTKSDIPFFSILTWQVANSLSTVIFVVVSTAITKSYFYISEAKYQIVCCKKLSLQARLGTLDCLTIAVEFILTFMLKRNFNYSPAKKSFQNKFKCLVRFWEMGWTENSFVWRLIAVRTQTLIVLAVFAPKMITSGSKFYSFSYNRCVSINH